MLFFFFLMWALVRGSGAADDMARGNASDDLATNELPGDVAWSEAAGNVNWSVWWQKGKLTNLGKTGYEQILPQFIELPYGRKIQAIMTFYKSIYLLIC